VIHRGLGIWVTKGRPLTPDHSRGLGVQLQLEVEA
jgi:hypothetical protein